MSRRIDDQRNLRQAAWGQFDRGEFDAAEVGFQTLSHAGMIEEAELHALVEILKDRGEGSEAGAAIDRALEQWAKSAEPVSAVPWLSLQFDLAAHSEEGRARALRLLETLAGTRNALEWTAVLTCERLTAIEASFHTPLDRLEYLERLALAPTETGLAERANATIEEIGLRYAGDAKVARAAERLLHAIGASAAAYRVERARRAAADRDRVSTTAKPESPALSFGGLTIVIAGGHPALRAMIERDLMRSGASRVRAIPSATEATRAGRDVQAILAGADLIVMLVRLITHSTSDQVRRAAAKTGVPVVFAESAGITGVHRAIETFLREQ